MELDRGPDLLDPGAMGALDDPLLGLLRLGHARLGGGLLGGGGGRGLVGRRLLGHGLLGRGGLGLLACEYYLNCRYSK